MNGIITLERYKTKSECAHLLKAGDASAIRWTAMRMSELLPSSLPLIPVPSHFGYATTMLALANEISKINGNPVADVLRGNHRESLYTLKYAGVSVDPSYLGMYATAKVNGIILDNVVATGMTVKCARLALGNLPCICFAGGK